MFSGILEIHPVEIWPKIGTFIEIFGNIHCQNLKFYFYWFPNNEKQKPKHCDKESGLNCAAEKYQSLCDPNVMHIDHIFKYFPTAPDPRCNNGVGCHVVPTQSIINFISIISILDIAEHSLLW